MSLVHVIDDDASVREVIGILCRSISAKVKEYSSIEEFDRRGEHDQNECVLLDMRLPKLGGLPGVHHMRRTYPSLPIIGMSAHATTRTVALAMKAGAVDFFDKPFVPQDLLDSIQEALSHAEASQIPQEVAIRIELLSRTQRQVLARLAAGLSVDEVATALALHKKSVQRHRRNALDKLKLAPGEEGLLATLLEPSG